MSKTRTRVIAPRLVAEIIALSVDRLARRVLTKAVASTAELDLAPEASLLAADEPPAFELIGGAAMSPFLITCDHAGNRLPRLLGCLGLAEPELTRHIAWDLGAAQVTRRLARELGAF